MEENIIVFIEKEFIQDSLSRLERDSEKEMSADEIRSLLEDIDDKLGGNFVNLIALEQIKEGGLSHINIDNLSIVNVSFEEDGIMVNPKRGGNGSIKLYYDKIDPKIIAEILKPLSCQNTVKESGLAVAHISELINELLRMRQDPITREPAEKGLFQLKQEFLKIVRSIDSEEVND